MPNRFTRVPLNPPPRPGARMAPVVAVADVFMGTMLSRPGGLSLARAWVTPATLALAAGFALASVVLATALLLRGGWLSGCAAALLLAVSAGSAAVAVVGAFQRRQSRS